MWRETNFCPNIVPMRYWPAIRSIRTNRYCPAKSWSTNWEKKLNACAVSWTPKYWIACDRTSWMPNWSVNFWKRKSKKRQPKSGYRTDLCSSRKNLWRLCEPGINWHEKRKRNCERGEFVYRNRFSPKRERTKYTNSQMLTTSAMRSRRKIGRQWAKKVHMMLGHFSSDHLKRHRSSPIARTLIRKCWREWKFMDIGQTFICLSTHSLRRMFCNWFDSQSTSRINWFHCPVAGGTMSSVIVLSSHHMWQPTPTGIHFPLIDSRRHNNSKSR